MTTRLNLRLLRNVSIQRKLTLIIMAATTVALLLISGAFVTYELFTFKHRMIDDLATQAEMTALRSTAALTFENPQDADEILRALSHTHNIVAACIYRDGKIFAQYPPDLPTSILPPSPEPEGARFERNHLVLFHQVVDNDGAVIGVLYLKSDLQELHRRLARYGGIILLFMLASSLVTFLLSSSLQRIISEPISHLAETARAVSAGKNYSVRALKQSQDELGQFVDAFNDMLAQIQERDAALQQAHDKLEKRVEERTRDLQSEITERKRAEEGLQQQLARISLLNQITQVILDRQDLPSILQVVLRQLCDHLPVDLGGIFLLENGSDTLTLGALQERHPLPATGAELRVGRMFSLAGNALEPCETGGTIYLPETKPATHELARQLNAAGMNSAVAVPLMVEGKLLGILSVARQQENGFSNGECEFLRMLSEHVALAAHQAQLYGELEMAYNDLRQTQQAVMQQDRLHALGQMASGIAHDVNNALAPVVGFAGLLLEFEPGLSQTAKKHLKYIQTAGEDVAHIVARLREFYRQREGQESLHSLSLNQLAEQVIEMTRPRWRDIPQRRGIMVELETAWEPGLPQLIGIESEVREALTNLILNAVDAMPKGGKLIFRTRIGRVGLASSGDSTPTHAVLEVTDSGVGMSQETLKRCLEPFFSTKGQRGTGMGLAMVYGVMERHEGKIELESDLGKGTTVRLIFPLRAHTANGATAPKTGARLAGNLQVLCIDDEPLLRELVKEMLENDGHQVQVADSGQTGLDAFHKAVQRGRPFDVVITDLGMPYLDGREVAKTLKSEAPATPVIMLTGWGAFMKSDGDVPQYVDGILSKPPRANELREILARLTQKPAQN